MKISIFESHLAESFELSELYTALNNTTTDSLEQLLLVPKYAELLAEHASSFLELLFRNTTGRKKTAVLRILETPLKPVETAQEFEGLLISATETLNPEIIQKMKVLAPSSEIDFSLILLVACRHGNYETLRVLCETFDVDLPKTVTPEILLLVIHSEAVSTIQLLEFFARKCVLFHGITPSPKKFRDKAGRAALQSFPKAAQEIFEMNREPTTKFLTAFWKEIADPASDITRHIQSEYAKTVSLEYLENLLNCKVRRR